ncbi:hypothetical protein [Streptomyces fractus]|uniref:hypothetical protein n=1 Tax=Streptomyces fractus TaxID=641806 RepID=UPI003CE82DE5
MTRPLDALRHETAGALRCIRTHWGTLRLTVESPPVDVWPPRHLAALLAPGRDTAEPLLEKAPLTLREHPAPLNLDALDTKVAIEEALYELADVLAADVQRAEAGDPWRWNFPTATGPGSRAQGPHWAALYIERRVRDTDTEPEQREDGTWGPAPFGRLPEARLREAHRVAGACERRLLRTLGIDQRSTPIPDRPCPWCTGQLVLHQPDPDEPPTITCDTGPSCTAPVITDERGRRTWRWRDLPALAEALEAGERRAAPNWTQIN